VRRGRGRGRGAALAVGFDEVLGEKLELTELERDGQWSGGSAMLAFHAWAEGVFGGKDEVIGDGFRH
jgi:hypothetical protein